MTANGKVLRRTYEEVADRARGLAYYLKKHGYKRVGILAPNTPAFLESLFGIAAASGISVGMYTYMLKIMACIFNQFSVAVNYRLKQDDISYIFQHSDVDAIVVDAEFLPLLDGYRKAKPGVPLIVDLDTDVTEGELSGPFDEAVLEGLRFDKENGGKGWSALETQVSDEESVIALAYTSGTTARPKGVECTHRGAYLAALANAIESGVNFDTGRCRYLWTLPMFHATGTYSIIRGKENLLIATGWTFPWAITAVRGTHYCLRKIDYPHIWRLLKEEKVTHFNAAPTVNTLLCNDKNAERLDHPVRVTVAASPPTAHLFEMMTNLNLHPVHVYGLTETYGPITKGYIMPSWNDLPTSEKYARMARQGHGFVTSQAVRVIKTDQPDGVIVDVEKNGSEIGEIVFTGNICAKGYYKDPEATRKLWLGGVCHSGDLAVWHPDGAVQILDRAKDIIISGEFSALDNFFSCLLTQSTGGENISSVALESMLVQHPDVLEAGVVAIADSHWGERPKAFITVKEGKNVRGEDIIDWAKHRSNISKFMVPREVEIIKELPKTSTGKIKKNILREWAKGANREQVN